MRSMAVRMKLVVPFTMPCTRSMWAAASVSEITRMAGTTPATAASKRSWTPASPAALEQLLAVAGHELLVGGHEVLAGAGWRSARTSAPGPCPRSARRSGRCGRGCRRSRRGCGSARPTARGGGRPRPRSPRPAWRAAPRRPPRPCRGRAARPGRAAPSDVTGGEVVEGLAAHDHAGVAVAAEHHRGAAARRCSCWPSRDRMRPSQASRPRRPGAGPRARPPPPARRPTRSACRRSGRAWSHPVGRRRRPRRRRRRASA